MKMRLIVVGVAIASGVLVTATRAGAQGPVAVPIIGSPAAQQPQPQQRPPFVPPPVQPPPTSAPGPSVAPPSMAAIASQAGAARSARKLDLTFKDGTIALDAQNVTLREILNEWQRRGGCRFVNADKLTGGPVTRQFPQGTPELEAIDSLLRDLRTDTTGYGYMVGPPSTQRADNQSLCGAVYILTMSRPSAAPAGYMPPGGSPIAAPLVMPGSPDDEIPPVVPFQPPPPRPNPNPGGQQEGSPNTPPPGQTPGFGAQAPSATAPGAGRNATPPGNQPPGGAGRGGNQAP